MRNFIVSIDLQFADGRILNVPYAVTAEYDMQAEEKAEFEFVKPMVQYSNCVLLSMKALGIR